MILRIDLADDTLPKHYTLDYGSSIPTFLHGKATLLVDENDNMKCYIDEDFEFKVESEGHYVDSGSRCVYDRYLLLPNDLVSDFAIDAGDGIELVLNEVVIKDEIEKIFSKRRVEGSMDFELKGFSGEVMNSSESLITTKFTDEFYDKLVLEINNAFKIRLFTATMVLVRKLFEKLIIDLLRQKYGMPQMELFYSEDDNGFLSLSKLISNLRKKIDDFKPYDFFKLEREKESFLNFLWKIREEGSASAHFKESLLGRKEIGDLKPSINKYSDLFVRLIQRVKETPHNP